MTKFVSPWSEKYHQMQMCTSEIKPRRIYLASPYSSDIADERARRHNNACHATTRLIDAGNAVFSPIVYSVPLSLTTASQYNWGGWRNFDILEIASRDELWVLQLDGWEKSIGVQAEIAVAIALGKPIKYVNPSTLETSDDPWSDAAICVSTTPKADK